MNHWEGVEAFVQVVRLGTLSAAAKALGVSVSHISRSISRLENRLGAQLLVRSTRQVRTTDVGRGYYEQCQQLLDGLGLAEQQVRDYQSAPSGLLRISCGTVFGERYIAPLLNDFLRQYPELELDLHLTNRTVDLIADGFDVVIRMGMLRDSALVGRRLCERREYLVAAPDYLSRAGQPQTIAELAEHRCLAGSNEHWRFRAEEGVREWRVRGRWRANSGLAVLDATLKGMGIAQLPDYYVAGFLRRGELIALLPETQVRESAVWALYPKSRHLAPKVRLLVEFLQQVFAEAPPASRPFNSAMLPESRC